MIIEEVRTGSYPLLVVSNPLLHFAYPHTSHQRDRVLSLLQLNIISPIQSVLSYRVCTYRVHTCTVTVTPAHPPLSVAVSL